MPIEIEREFRASAKRAARKRGYKPVGKKYREFIDRYVYGGMRKRGLM